MEEQDKLDDFFQNRLQQDGGSDDDWDRPRGEVWEGASGHFPTHPVPLKWSRLWLAGIGLALLFIGMGTYAYSLKQEVKELEIQLQQTPSVPIAQTNIVNQKETAIINELQTKNAQLKAQLSTITQTNNTLLNKVKSLQLQNSNRSNHPTAFTTLNTYNPSPILNNELVIRPLINLNIHTTSAKTKAQTSLALLDSPTEEVRSQERYMPEAASPEFDKKTLRRFKDRKWEFGHTIGLYSKVIPLETNFDEETFFQESNQVIIAQGFTNGLQANYKLKDNLFLRSGFKLSLFGYKVPTNVSWVYDKSSEFTDIEGNTVNQFVVSTNSDYNTVENQFNVTIPEDMPLDDGDIVEAEIFNIQTQRTFQFPIGLNYYIGEKKLKAIIGGGVSLNLVQLGDYQIGATFKHLEQDLEVNEVELLSRSRFNTTQLGGHMGFGLDYQLGRRWHLRSGLVFEGNLFSFNNLLNSNGSQIQNAVESQLEFGLFCRF